MYNKIFITIFGKNTTMPPRSLYFTNPFVMNPDIPDIYFCDRETETAWLISTIINGNNAVLTAERRMGKSSLLKHVLRQKEITNDYNTKINSEKQRAIAREDAISDDMLNIKLDIISATSLPAQVIKSNTAA